MRWISFHSAYDFGYLIKLITNANLPDTEDEFFDLLHTYFPFVYDIKYLMKSCETLKGGLNQLAEDLKIVRIGPAHQAGSDSLLTLLTFFKMMQLFFENKFDDEKYIGVLYGIGKGFYGNGSVFGMLFLRGSNKHAFQNRKVFPHPPTMPLVHRAIPLWMIMPPWTE